MKCDLLTSLTIMQCILMARHLYHCQLSDVEKDNALQTNNNVSRKLRSQNKTSSKSMVEMYAMLQHNDKRDDIIKSVDTDFNNSSVNSNADRNISKVHLSSETSEKPKRDLPVALIIAVPTAAVSISVFLCIAYYFHNAQLNRKAKRLSVTLYVPPDLNSISSNCSSPSGMPPSQKCLQSARHSRDSDLLGPRRKSMISIHTLSIPPAIQGKRGSNWSALADQEILSLSAPRRHSTFIL